MALGWLVIGIIILVSFMLIFKSQDLIYIFALVRKYFVLISVIFIALFIVFSLYTIYNRYDLNLTTFEGIMKAGKIYFAWITSLFNNIGDITGYAIKKEWIINNTNITN